MTVLTLQPDEAAAQDTGVTEQFADATLGDLLGTDLAAVGFSTIRRSTFIKFDLSSISAGATINSATLSLWAHGGPQPTSGISPVLVRRILPANSGWIEDTHWNFADGSTLRWAGDSGADGGPDAGCSVSGTDFSATALGTFTAGSADADGTQYDISLDPTEFAVMVAANHGMVIYQTVTNGQGVQFSGSGDATSTLRPKLVVDWTAAGGGGSGPFPPFPRRVFAPPPPANPGYSLLLARRLLPATPPGLTIFPPYQTRWVYPRR